LNHSVYSLFTLYSLYADVVSNNIERHSILRSIIICSYMKGRLTDVVPYTGAVTN